MKKLSRIVTLSPVAVAKDLDGVKELPSAFEILDRHTRSLLFALQAALENRFSEKVGAVMEPILVTKTDLTLALAEEAVAILLGKGEVKAVAGRYDLEEAVRSCLPQIGSFIQGADVKEQINAERTILNDLESELNEIQAKLVSGDAFYTADTERVLTETFMQIRSKILGIAGRCPRLVCHQRTVTDFETVLQEPIDEAFNCLRPFSKDDFTSRDVAIVQDKDEKDDLDEK